MGRLRRKHGTTNRFFHRQGRQLADLIEIRLSPACRQGVERVSVSRRIDRPDGTGQAVGSKGGDFIHFRFSKDTVCHDKPDRRICGGAVFIPYVQPLFSQTPRRIGKTAAVGTPHTCKNGILFVIYIAQCIDDNKCPRLYIAML